MSTCLFAYNLSFRVYEGESRLIILFEFSKLDSDDRLTWGIIDKVRNRIIKNFVR